jgi:polyribonucleotide nucleotidyltransferase
VDIAGSEDHLGDMDFKVAGTAAGITALQLDTKLPGLPLPLVAAALGPAASARRQVLGVMEGAWAAWEASTPGALRARHGTTTINRELVPRLVGLQVRRMVVGY